MPEPALEGLGGPLDSDADELYDARAPDVQGNRPVLTGDVFRNVPVDGESTDVDPPPDFMIVQHPCSLRRGGIQLVDKLLVARVIPLTITNWKGHQRHMPLPFLRDDADDQPEHAAASFADLAVVRSADLVLANREACLSRVGVALFLQRWIYYSSRFLVPRRDLDGVIAPAFEEADIIEEWCETADAFDIPVAVASQDCIRWLTQDDGGQTRQQKLEDAGSRAAIRKAARRYRLARHPEEWQALIA